MKKILALLVYLLVAQQCIHAQQRKISGKVFVLYPDYSTTPPGVDTADMPGVGVALLKSIEKRKSKNLYAYGTVTDANCDFELTVPATDTQSYPYLKFTPPFAKPVIIALDPQTFNTTNIFYVKPEYNRSPAEYNEIVTPYKPAIYLYPTQETKVTVKHDFKGTIGTTYPAYNDGWEVIAQPSGALYNTQDKRQYEYLFWDGTTRFPQEHFDYKTGFVVEKEKCRDFLWEKLALIGLNNKEINDFVVYWLPQLERHSRCFIHFRINDDIDHSSILTVNPEPDSRIRLFMEFRPVEADFHITPQPLKTYPRKGFTLVEWGGSPVEVLSEIQ